MHSANNQEQDLGRTALPLAMLAWVISWLFNASRFLLLPGGRMAFPAGKSLGRTMTMACLFAASMGLLISPARTAAQSPTWIWSSASTPPIVIVYTVHPGHSPSMPFLVTGQPTGLNFAMNAPYQTSAPSSCPACWTLPPASYSWREVNSSVISTWAPTQQRPSAMVMESSYIASGQAPSAAAVRATGLPLLRGWRSREPAGPGCASGACRVNY